MTSFDREKNEWGEDRPVRTDWLGNADGIGNRLFTMARQLKGHRVRLWVELEPMAGSNGQSVRMLRHLEDLGFDEEFAKENPAA